MLGCRENKILAMCPVALFSCATNSIHGISHVCTCAEVFMHTASKLMLVRTLFGYNGIVSLCIVLLIL